MGGCVTKKQAISRAQYLDPVYQQFGTLYEMLIDAMRPSFDLKASKCPNMPPIDGVIGYVSQNPTKASSKQKMVSNTSSNNPSKNSSSPSKKYKVHVFQSTAIDKSSKGKKKGKGKAKSDAPKQYPPKPFVDEAYPRKLKYPCLICEENHYTKYFP